MFVSQVGDLGLYLALLRVSCRLLRFFPTFEGNLNAKRDEAQCRNFKKSSDCVLVKILLNRCVVLNVN